MTKTAIYQYWDGPVRESVHAGVRNMKAYADRIGADYLFEDNPNWLRQTMKMDFGQYSPHYGAFKPLYDSAWDKYDKILFADTDVFAVDNLEENIFDAFHAEIGICEEPFQPQQRTITLGRITSEADNLWAKTVEAAYGVPMPRTEEGLVKVYNTGMVLYSAAGRKKAQSDFVEFDSYVKLIRDARLDSFYTCDQPYLHAMMFAKGFDVQIMDGGWNSYIHGTKDKINPQRRIMDWRNGNSKFVHCQFPGADDMDAEQLWKVVNLERKDWDYDI